MLFNFSGLQSTGSAEITHTTVIETGCLVQKVKGKVGGWSERRKVMRAQ